MLNEADTNNLIRWSDDGRAICIPDVATFSKDILSQYFKHSNWPSFIRQLNRTLSCSRPLILMSSNLLTDIFVSPVYGFRRVNLPDPSAGNEPRQTYYFMNENFIRDESELLRRIKRRSSVRVPPDERSPENRQRRRSPSSSRRGSDDREHSNDYVEFASNADAAEARILQLDQMVKFTEEQCSNLASKAVELRSVYNKQQELLSTLLESVQTLSSIVNPNSGITEIFFCVVKDWPGLVK
ncbi:hypothetical protein BDB00DRAFT_531050 [Zychaea mexicana]|uniref:uncharacterized protein n=1 Tax=Zychaea mexicana TaxID=64656 RepID=UPI0022FE8F92|nr:uncharacterized protein BDB00DRAFT_531050 [Zychaea mexicana]KAI9490835.1 hypothetical protein BDB00DRAFT_531050 [Zychaea mexicana]